MEEKNTNYMELSCQDFMEQLAGPGAVPGGGGAAAPSGALGMGLMSIVASLTIGKKKYAAVEAEVKQLHNRAESLRLALMQGVDKDAEVFAPLAQAYRLPDGTPEELAAKARVLSECSMKAADLPLTMAHLCRDGLEVAVRLAEIGSLMAVSDVVCGAGLLLAALKGLLVMVSVNLPLVADEGYVHAVEEEYSKLMLDATNFESQVSAKIEARTRKLFKI